MLTNMNSTSSAPLGRASIVAVAITLVLLVALPVYRALSGGDPIVGCVTQRDLIGQLISMGFSVAALVTLAMTAYMSAFDGSDASSAQRTVKLLLFAAPMLYFVYRLATNPCIGG
ncbi:MAG: hypothetical protein H7Z42_04220 [Roseiflexaceae bacterium]|nr:hypothetical protein [Roseiflexaceae bacterium]